MKIKNSFALLIVALFCTGCASDAPMITIHDDIRINNSTMRLIVGDDGTQSLSFKASDEWTISVTDTTQTKWCTVSPMSGQAGDVVVNITTPENMINDRTAKLTIDVQGTKVTVDVFQEFGNGVEDIPIPDENFRSYCLNWFDINRNRKISYKEIKDVEQLLVRNSRIESLRGLEYFRSLRKLDFYYNKVGEIDISRNTLLEYFCCDNNPMKSLDLSNCVKLNEVVCSNSNLTSLDVSKLTQLRTLECINTNIKTLDVSNNLKLISLRYYNNSTDNLELWLLEGQEIKNLWTYNTVIKYKSKQN